MLLFALRSLCVVRTCTEELAVCAVSFSLIVLRTDGRRRWALFSNICERKRERKRERKEREREKRREREMETAEVYGKNSAINSS